MDQLEHGPGDVEPGKRMTVLANAVADAKELMDRGEHETNDGARTELAAGEVDKISAGWPEAARMGAAQMVAQYGQPNEGTATKLLWYRRGPWKRIQVTSDEVVHKFPTPHADFLTQYIDYEVPVDKLGELGRYDGSCLIDRTMGEAAARCDSEAANILTLNLMHEIVTGSRNVDDARDFYSETLSAYCLGEPAPYCEQFQFDVPSGRGDSDQPVPPGPKAAQAAKKVEEFLASTGRA
ncbi:MAG: hypothetical protein H0X18_15740 [Geodermatophilaceae bacterium]|nr:hypothetical protein [Geodermatophilaceae bacterium]